MTYMVELSEAEALFPQYTFVGPLTPSAQKAAFHVRDEAGNDLCLKLIAPDYAIDRLGREILALQEVSHENVVSLQEYTFTSSASGQRHYIVEEFIAGCDLSERLGSAWDSTDAAAFFSALADGLAALHGARIVHRDLKPSNIRVRDDGSPVVIDFGIARHLTLSDLTNTSQGAALGTPLYFAPEQFDGTKHEIDHRTDLFAFGILLFEALAGSHPFYVEGMNYAQLRDAVSRGVVAFDGTAAEPLSNTWKVLLTRLLHKERARRPHSAQQVKTILGKIGSQADA